MCLWCADLPFCIPLGFFQSVPALHGSINEKNQVTSCWIYVRNTHTNWGFPYSSVGKESTWDAGDPSLIPGSGRSSREGIGCPLQYSWASLVAQLIKNPPAVWEIWVRSLGWEDPLEKARATHSSILAWRIPWTSQKSQTQLSNFHFMHINYICLHTNTQKWNSKDSWGICRLFFLFFVWLFFPYNRCCWSECCFFLFWFQIYCDIISSYKLYLLRVYGQRSFDKYVHLYNHHYNQGIEHHP